MFKILLPNLDFLSSCTDLSSLHFSCLGKEFWELKSSESEDAWLEKMITLGIQVCICTVHAWHMWSGKEIIEDRYVHSHYLWHGNGMAEHQHSVEDYSPHVIPVIFLEAPDYLFKRNGILDAVILSYRSLNLFLCQVNTGITELPQCVGKVNLFPECPMGASLSLRNGRSYWILLIRFENIALPAGMEKELLVKMQISALKIPKGGMKLECQEYRKFGCRP